MTSTACSTPSTATVGAVWLPHLSVAQTGVTEAGINNLNQTLPKLSCSW